MPPSYNVAVRRRLMRVIADVIEERGLRQREAAELFGTTQPRISEIVRDKVDEFTIDALVNMLARAGLPVRIQETTLDSHAVPSTHTDPVIEAYKAGVDRTLIRESLRKTPTERVLALAALQGLAEEAATAGRNRATRH